MRTVALLASCLGTLIALGLSACELDDTIDGYTPCFDRDAGTYVPCCGPTGTEFPCPPDGGSDADAGADGEDADAEADASSEDGGPEAGTDGGVPFCSGICTPQVALGWFTALAWMGPEGMEPAVPYAPTTAWQGWVDVTFFDATCPTCTCAAPTGGCVLPTSWNATSLACQDPSAQLTLFDAPPGWDGTCTTANSIPAGKDCGGKPCVQSLLVEPPHVEGSCAPQPGPSEQPGWPAPQRTKVRAYNPDEAGKCAPDVQRCLPTPPEGYKVCIFQKDVAEECPAEWPERHEGWQVAEDTRNCTACSCGPVEGSFCAAQVRAYEDAACTKERGSLFLPSNEAAKCTDLPSGVALGSKSAEVIDYQPGACQESGGELVGTVEVKSPAVFCCLP